MAAAKKTAAASAAAPAAPEADAGAAQPSTEEQTVTDIVTDPAPPDAPPTIDEAPKVAEARALIDLPALGIKAGRLLVAAPAVVAQLVAAGEADDHPDAVAYAKTLTN